MKHALILISILGCVYAMAGDPAFNDRTTLPPISISNAIKNAIESHPQSQITLQNLEVAHQDMLAARSALTPSATANYGYVMHHNPVNVGVGDANIGTAGLVATQPLFDLSAIYLYKASKYRLLAAASMVDNDQLKIAAQAASTYLDVLKLRITLDFAKENYQFLSELLESMKSGSVTATADDIKLAETALSSALNNKYVWIQETEVAENNFSRDTLLTAQNYFLIEPTAISIPQNAEAAIQVAFQSNPSIIAAQKRIESKDKDEKAARSAYLPRVELSVAAYDVDRPKKDFARFERHGASAGVIVSIPVFGGRKASNLARENALAQISELTLQDQKTNLATALDNTYVRINQRNLRLKTLCSSVQSRLATVESMRKRLIKEVTVQDFLFQRDALLNNAVSLNNEFLSEVLDTFSVHVQTGTLIENLPPSSDASQKRGPNPQYKGAEVYEYLLKRCRDHKLI